MKSILCPLCSNPDNTAFFSLQEKVYWSCSICGLIHLDPACYISPSAEHQRYMLHNNDSGDPAYLSFLDRLIDPLTQRINPGAKGLDFGSGPNPVLQLNLQQRGYQVSIYDHFFARDEHVFERHYDFITACEVVEHLHHPRYELDRLWARLTPQGLLGIMTSLVLPSIDFANWHYRRDETHVVFYRSETMHWLAERWQAHLNIINDRVIFFKKGSETF